MDFKSRRFQRLEKELRELVANFLISGRFKGSLEGLVSISYVNLNSDLRRAKVFFSVFGSEADKKKSHTEILSRIPEIQNHINKHLRMKFSPRLSFHWDQKTERILKIENLIRRNHPKDVLS